jgi:acetyl-CoA synthetase
VEAFSTRRLIAQAAKFAGLLHTLGVQRRDVVLSMTSTIPEAFAALLGSLRHGATFGAVDPSLPAAELSAALRRTRARLLLLEAGAKARVDPLRADHLDLWHVVAIERFGRVGRMGAGDFLWADYFDPAPEQDEPIAWRGVEPALVDPAGGALWAHQTATAARRLGRACFEAGPVACALAPAHPFWPVLGVLAPLSAGGELLAAHESAALPPAPAAVGIDGDVVEAPEGWRVPLTRAGRLLPGMRLEPPGPAPYAAPFRSGILIDAAKTARL